MKKTYVIIGNSAAGLAAANRLKELDPGSKIICISKEQEKPYNKCRLTDYLSGDMSESGVFLGKCEYLPANNFSDACENGAENGIEFIFGAKVEKVLLENNPSIHLASQGTQGERTEGLSSNIDGEVAHARDSLSNASFENSGSTGGAVGPDNNRVLLESGKAVRYDKLFIATGAKPVRLNVPGAHAAGTFVFHTLQDTNNILKFTENNKPKRAVIIGSGMTGMECAGALHARNIDVEIVEMGTHILSNCCDKIGAEFIENAIYKKISGFSGQYEQEGDESSSCSEIFGQDVQENGSKKIGVNIYHNESVKEIISENGKISCVVLNSGKFIATDMVVFAVGVRADTDLAKDAGIEIGEFGIVTNDFMNTNIADIYAGGDCAQVKDIVSGNLIRSNAWHDATTQGQIAAENMYLSCIAQSSDAIKYIGALPTSYSDIFGINFASYLGAIKHNLKYEFIFDVGPNFYNKIWLQDGFVKGFVLIGDISKIGKLKRAIIAGKKLEI